MKSSIRLLFIVLSILCIGLVACDRYDCWIEEESYTILRERSIDIENFRPIFDETPNAVAQFIHITDCPGSDARRYQEISFEFDYSRETISLAGSELAEAHCYYLYYSAWVRQESRIMSGMINGEKKGANWFFDITVEIPRGDSSTSTLQFEDLFEVE